MQILMPPLDSTAANTSGLPTAHEQPALATAAAAAAKEQETVQPAVLHTGKGQSLSWSAPNQGPNPGKAPFDFGDSDDDDEALPSSPVAHPAMDCQPGNKRKPSSPARPSQDAFEFANNTGGVAATPSSRLPPVCFQTGGGRLLSTNSKATAAPVAAFDFGDSGPALAPTPPPKLPRICFQTGKGRPLSTATKTASTSAAYDFGDGDSTPAPSSSSGSGFRLASGGSVPITTPASEAKLTSFLAGMECDDDRDATAKPRPTMIGAAPQAHQPPPREPLPSLATGSGQPLAPFVTPSARSVALNQQQTVTPSQQQQVVYHNATPKAFKPVTPRHGFTPATVVSSKKMATPNSRPFKQPGRRRGGPVPSPLAHCTTVGILNPRMRSLCC